MIQDTDVFEVEDFQLETDDEPNTSEALIPHLALRLETLSRALQDATGNVTAISGGDLPRNEIISDARVWIFRRTRGAVLPFNDVCEALNLDPEGVREAVRKRIRAGERFGPIGMNNLTVTSKLFA